LALPDQRSPWSAVSSTARRWVSAKTKHIATSTVDSLQHGLRKALLAHHSTTSMRLTHSYREREAMQTTWRKAPSNPPSKCTARCQCPYRRHAHSRVTGLEPPHPTGTGRHGAAAMPWSMRTSPGSVNLARSCPRLPLMLDFNGFEDHSEPGQLCRNPLFGLLSYLTSGDDVAA
jgi:hypothetical protein